MYIYIYILYLVNIQDHACVGWVIHCSSPLFYCSTNALIVMLLIPVVLTYVFFILLKFF